MNQEQKRPVTLENLLQLKRAERPPAEFWNQFDRELRAKQLAALVEKRPWWRTFPRAFGSLSRYHLPLGGTAILALTVLTVREYRSPSAPAVAGTARTAVAVAFASPVNSNDVARLGVAAPLHEERAGVATTDGVAADSAELGLASEAVATGHLSQLVVPALTADSSRTATPATRFIAANLALAKAAEPAIAQNLLGASHGFEARAMPAKTPVVEPLSQMASPSDVRRSRLLNGAVMSVSMNTATPARAPEFRSRRISDEQLYDSISRFEGRGNSLAVKF